MNRPVDKAYVQHALERAGGKVVKAAESTGVSRSTMYRLMQQYGLHPSPSPQSNKGNDLWKALRR